MFLGAWSVVSRLGAAIEVARSDSDEIAWQFLVWTQLLDPSAEAEFFAASVDVEERGLHTGESIVGSSIAARISPELISPDASTRDPNGVYARRSHGRFHRGGARPPSDELLPSGLRAMYEDAGEGYITRFAPFASTSPVRTVADVLRARPGVQAKHGPYELFAVDGLEIAVVHASQQAGMPGESMPLFAGETTYVVVTYPTHGPRVVRARRDQAPSSRPERRRKPGQTWDPPLTEAIATQAPIDPTRAPSQENSDSIRASMRNRALQPHPTALLRVASTGSASLVGGGLTWASYLVDAPLEVLHAHYEAMFGPPVIQDDGRRTFAAGNERLSIESAPTQSPFLGAVKPRPGETFAVFSVRVGP